MLSLSPYPLGCLALAQNSCLPFYLYRSTSCCISFMQLHKSDICNWWKLLLLFLRLCPCYKPVCATIPNSIYKSARQVWCSVLPMDLCFAIFNACYVSCMLQKNQERDLFPLQMWYFLLNKSPYK